MDQVQAATLLMFQIDRQTYFNKLQYDRSLTEEDRKTIEQRLKLADEEYKTLPPDAFRDTHTYQ